MADGCRAGAREDQTGLIFSFMSPSFYVTCVSVKVSRWLAAEDDRTLYTHASEIQHPRVRLQPDMATPPSPNHSSTKLRNDT